MDYLIFFSNVFIPKNCFFFFKLSLKISLQRVSCGARNNKGHKKNMHRVGDFNIKYGKKTFHDLNLNYKDKECRF